MDCRHASQLISRSLDSRLSWRQRAGLRFHLMLCAACLQFSRQMALLRQAVQHLGNRLEHDETVRLSPAARRRIAAAVERQHAAPDGTRQYPDGST